MSAPTHVTGDRADRAVAGQFVHLAPFTLTDAVPDDGWLEVLSVSPSSGQVTLAFADESQLVVRGDRLVRLGWS